MKTPVERLVEYFGDQSKTAKQFAFHNLQSPNGCRVSVV